MTIVTLEIKDEKALKKIDSLERQQLVRIVNTQNPAKKRLLKGMRQSLKDVKLHEEGKLKLKSARELLNEL